MKGYNEKILGCLTGAAVGDAMGAATELRTKEMIKEKFGGTVTTILSPPDDTFARGSKAGAVTDDFSLLYYTAKAILDNGGVIEKKSAEKSILNWSEDKRFYDQYAGPTTRSAVERMKGMAVSNYYDFICCDNAKASNGSAMKIAPAGLFNPGNPDKAVEDAITICRPTHNNNLSIVGACAIAAAVSEAMKEEADVYSVVQAGFYGAALGERRCKDTCAVLAGPDVAKRMKMAVTIGMMAANIDEATTEIADMVGSGLHISEAVPAVFGILVAAKGNLRDCIVAAVNIGSDTDTIASMVGAVAGTLHGAGSLADEYLGLIEAVNGFDIRKLANDIADCLEGEQ